MTDNNRIILPINPQTTLRTTQGDVIVFRIPEKCYKGRGKKGCAIYKRTGLCKHTLSVGGRVRKRRIEKYNTYKSDLLTLAKKLDFVIPDYGWSVYFYFPMPKKWSRKDRELMHGQPHHRKSDLDNIYKALTDSLRVDDERIAQLSGTGKFWVNQEKGYIEILIHQSVYNPFGVPFIDQSQVKSLHQTSNYKKRLQEGGNIRSYKRKPKEDKIK